MSLEDYIEKEQNKAPKWVKFYYDINGFGIDEKKLDLIRSVPNYIKFYNYHSDINYYLHTFYKTMIQISTTSGGRMAALIDLVDESYNLEKEETMYDRISEEEYSKRINKYERVGSQKIYTLNLGQKLFDFLNIDMFNQFICYAQDGQIFIDEETAQKLSQISTEELGTMLAQIIEMELKNKNTGFYLGEDRVNYDLNLYYSKGENPQYKYANDELYYLGPKLVKKK